MQVAQEKAAVVNQQMQKQQPIPQVNNVPSYVPQQQTKQVYAPMSTVGGGQQYATKTSGSAATGLTSQYQPQAQYSQQVPQQQYQQQYQPQQYQQPQYQQKPKQANHMDEITRMLNG